MQYERATGKPHKRLLDVRELPEGCEALWMDFLELHGCRGSTGFGPMRITYLDIDAWERVNRVKLPAWQIEAIRKADSAYLASLPSPKSGGKA